MVMVVGLRKKEKKRGEIRRDLVWQILGKTNKEQKEPEKILNQQNKNTWVWLMWVMWVKLLGK